MIRRLLNYEDGVVRARAGSMTLTDVLYQEIPEHHEIRRY